MNRSCQNSRSCRRAKGELQVLTDKRACEDAENKSEDEDCESEHIKTERIWMEVKHQTDEYEEANRLARQYLEDSQVKSEREITKRRVQNNKRSLSSSEDEAGLCSTERKRVAVARRMPLPKEPSNRDAPASMRTSLPAESLEDQVAGSSAELLMQIAKNTDICKLLVTKLNTVEDKLDAIERNQQRLLQVLASQQPDSQMQHGLNLEPCTDIVEFTILETNLQDEEYFQKAVRFLSLIGGRNVGENTRRTMQAVASHAVWSGYSLYGKKQKAKLCELQVFQLIKRGVRRSLPESTDRDIEVQIMEFLKHAPQKARREAETQHRNTQMEANSFDED